MAPKNKSIKKEIKTKRRSPSRTPDGEEKRLISMAYSYAEEQMRKGTASSQIITHFLKMGAKREALERQILEEEVHLKKAKTEAIESQKRTEEMYKQALDAMRAYSGNGGGDE